MKVMALDSVCDSLWVCSTLCSCTRFILQKDSVKDGTWQYMVSSNLMSRLDMRANTNTNSFTVLQWSVKGSRAYMAFDASKIQRTMLQHPISKVTLSSASGKMLLMLHATIPRQSLTMAHSLQHFLDKASNWSMSLTVPIWRLSHSEYYIFTCWCFLINDQCPYRKVVCQEQPSPLHCQRSTVWGLDEGWPTYNIYPQPIHSSLRYQDSVWEITGMYWQNTKGTVYISFNILQSNILVV